MSGICSLLSHFYSFVDSLDLSQAFLLLTSSLEYLCKEASLIDLLVSEVDNLLEALAPNVRIVVTLDDLASGMALIDDE